MADNFDPLRQPGRRIFRPGVSDSRAQTFPGEANLRARFDRRVNSHPLLPAVNPREYDYYSGNLRPFPQYDYFPAPYNPWATYRAMPPTQFSNNQPSPDWLWPMERAPTRNDGFLDDALRHLTQHERAFVNANARYLGSAGFTREDILVLARIPTAWDYVLTHALVQRDRGLAPSQIMLQAFYPPVPVGSSERHNTRIRSPDASVRRRRPRRPRRSQALLPDLERRDERQLTEEERTNLEDAHSRWSPELDLRQMGLEFYLYAVPAELAAQIAGHKNLILSLAGLAYVEDHQHESTKSSHRHAVKTATNYLVDAQDEGLIAICDDVVGDYVGFCGDGVSAGFAALKDAIQDHQLNQIECNSELFAQAKRLFVQRQINQEAVELYPQESSGVAIHLSHQLRDLYGLEGVQTTERTRFPRAYQENPSQVRAIATRLRDQLDQPGEIYLNFLQSKAAIRQRLRQLFPEDYSRMDYELDTLTGEAENAINATDESGAEGETGASIADRIARAQIGHDLLLSLGNAHKNWYEEKLKEVLSDPAKLDGEMVQ